MKSDKKFPLEIYKDGELVYQGNMLLQYNDWLDHFKNKYPKSKITTKEEVMAQGYCVKCKAKKEMNDVKEVTMKNGRQANKGVCPTCNTSMFCIKGKGK
ncbi:MAG TPA: hypothetical protein ENH82_06705 [bacterium]|nr:hypothetical protein [bacterium]